MYLRILLVLALVLFACSVRERRFDEPVIAPTTAPQFKATQSTGPKESIPIDPDTVFFEFDRSELKVEGQGALKKAAAWLRKNPGVSLQIEGYCDEMGSDEYNYALGLSRSEAVKRYLVALGISSKRLTTVSFGRIEGASASTRKRNRRANFVLIYAE